jgi:hypothetical protein
MCKVTFFEKRNFDTISNFTRKVNYSDAEFYTDSEFERIFKIGAIVLKLFHLEKSETHTLIKSEKIVKY